MFTKEQREKAVGLYLSGKYDNHYQVCDELGYPAYSTLPCWVREARKNGAVGGPAMTAEPKKPCPYAVKAKAVGMAREGRLTQAEIADELGIRGAAQVSLWLRIANEEGMDALMPKWEKEQLRESLREQMEAENDTAATDCADGAAEAATEPEGACDATPGEAPPARRWTSRTSRASRASRTRCPGCARRTRGCAATSPRRGGATPR